MRSKVEFLEDRAMEQDGGLGVRIGGILEVVDVSVWAEATVDF